MADLIRSRSAARWRAPGELVYVGPPPAGPVTLDLIDYGEGEIRETAVESIADLPPRPPGVPIRWLNVNGVHDEDLVAAVGETFGLHPMAQEDVLDTGQRAKVDDYGNYLHITLKMTRLEAETDRLIVESVSLFLGADHVISFQERPGDVFEPIRKRLRDGKGRLRRMGPDYLVYCLIDAIVDGYFPILERAAERIDRLEDRVLESPGPDVVRDIHALKRQGLILRKSIWPVREVVGELRRSESPRIGEGMSVFLRDVYDHTLQVVETLEIFRDMAGGLLDVYLTSVSNRMNEIMKVLTLIATVFIPLTFITGIYGMNFEYIPGLDHPAGFWITFGLMGAIFAAMLMYFRRAKWL
jgi:magnesium transporter